MLNRLFRLMKKLTHNTVFADLLQPVDRALSRVRLGAADGKVLSMADFVALGVRRHLQGTVTLREQVQSLFHHDTSLSGRPPLARSTWSDALKSKPRREALRSLIPQLMKEADDILPDRLKDIPGLGQRPVRAIDGSYQQESAHYAKQAPKNGGDDNPKGHALLSFYNVRLGVPEAAFIETRNRHERSILRDYDQAPNVLTQERQTLWLVDRAYIDGNYWDQKKTKLGQTMITRMKSNLNYEVLEDNHIDQANEVNEGVIRDRLIRLDSAKQTWRLIVFVTRRGKRVEFLTNELKLEPGVIAFLYSRRWDEEKCFDTWKNDFSQAKAWGKSGVAIENQTLLAIITSILIALHLNRTLDEESVIDQKSLKKQDKRQNKSAQDDDGTDRPKWTGKRYRHTSKTSRQVLRFFQNCLDMIASPELYQRHLRPMLQAYL